MGKKAPQSVNWNFPVTPRQLTLPGSTTLIPGWFGNFRDDTNELLGVSSDQYGVIQNSMLVDTARMALARRGLSGYREKLLSVGDSGQRFYAEFTFSDKQLATAKGDIFGYKLVLKNSFDLSLRLTCSLGFERLVCTNGMSTLEKEFGMTKRHSNKVTVESIGDAIDTALNHSENAMKVYDEMANVELSDEQGISVLSNLVRMDALSQILAKAMRNVWLNPTRAEDKGRTLYHLYNAITDHLTHQVEADHYEQANKLSNQLLFRFVNAARNPNKLTALLLPVIDAEIVTD